MTKVVHILGRGVEGCGVTRFTLELKDWAISQGWDYTVYASTDKKWTRSASHVLDDNIKQWRWGNKPLRGTTQCGVDLIIEDANKADIVLIGSLPSQSHPADMIENFGKLIDGITSKKVMIQHDHKMMSIKRNAMLDKTIMAADVILAYSTQNPFMEYCRNIGAKANLLNFCNGVNLERIRAKYWKPIEDQDPNHLKWIGRSAYWKGFDVLFDLYENGTKGTDLLYTLEGMERSIQFATIKEKWDFHHPQEDFSAKTIHGEKPYIFGPFIHADMLERMSLCGFGFQLTTLQPEYIQNFIEFTHLEIVASGVIPIFRKSYGDHCTHLKTGNKLSADKNTGTIWAGEVGSDLTDTINIINTLRKDSVMRNEWREMAYEYYASHNSPDSSFNDIFEKIARPVEGPVSLDEFFG
jgi:hypothetical protein